MLQETTDRQPMYELDPTEKPVKEMPPLPQWAPVTKDAEVPVSVSAAGTLAGDQRDYQKACLGTTCCGISGALGTILCCNSFRGRAGAATGCAVVTSIKLFLTILLLTLTFAVGCHMMEATPPQQVEGLKYSWDITAEECKAAGGSWRDHSPLGPWCSGACPTGYVYRRSKTQGRPEQAEYCVENAKVGEAEPVPPPQMMSDKSHHRGGWWAKWFHHHGHHHHGRHNGRHGHRHHHDKEGGIERPRQRGHHHGSMDGEMRHHPDMPLERPEGIPTMPGIQRIDDMPQRPEDIERPERMPNVPRPEIDQYDSQDAGRRDGADNADARDAGDARDAAVRWGADGDDFADDDDDDADGEFFLRHRGLVVVYAFGLALITTLFFALRRHWLRRATIADEQQRAWVIVSLSETDADTALQV